MTNIKKMSDFDLKDLRKHLAIILFLLLGYISFLIIRPFILSLIVGIILAFIFYPLFSWANKYIKHKATCSFIVTLVLLIILSIPLTFLLNIIAKEAFTMYTNSVQMVNQEDFILKNFNCTENEHIICTGLDFIETKINPNFNEQIAGSVTNIAQRIISGTAGFIASVPNTILQFAVLILTIFIVFINGPALAEKVKKLIPLSKNHKEKLAKEFKNIVDGVIYGQILTAIVQGFVASIGFIIFDVPSPFIWGLFSSFFSLIPFLGAAGVWVPISVIKLITALIMDDPTGIGQAIGLMIFGTLVISMIDNFIKPKFIGDRAKLNALLALVSILGGLIAFGIAGVIIGPVVIAMFIAVINIYIYEVDTQES